MVWFRMNVGRSNNADPKWIVPVICRLGHITKNEIGIIKIFDKETKFEILEEAAGKFASSVRKNSGEENVNIQPAAGTLQELRKFTPKPYGSNKDSAGYKGGADGKPRNFDKPGEQGERKGLFKKDFSAPKKEFAGPKKEYSGPKKEFSGPKKDFAGPKKDFSGERPAYAGKPAGERTDGPKKFGKKHRPKAD
jgi:ATP-dependent RNA helicase DeaD